LPPAADFVGGLGAALLAGAVAWTAYLVAWRLCPLAPAAVRLSASAVVAYWLLISVFWIASGPRLFAAATMLPLWMLLAVGAHLAFGRDGRAARTLADDLAAGARLLLDRLRSADGLLIGGLGLLVAVRGLRSAMAPPLAWDDLTYHLLKAGRFVQAGGHVAAPAPDAWGYYEYFPPTGDILWAWAMLATRSDGLIAAAGTFVWMSALLAAYGCARQLGASPRHGVLAAVTLGALPSTLCYVGTGYVDNTTLAFFVLAALFVTRLVMGGPVAEVPLAIAALALMVGTRITTAPAAALAAVGLALAVVQRGGNLPRWVIAASLVAAGAGLPPYVRAWLETGSPLYPYPLSVLGRRVFEGNDALARYASGQALPARFHLESQLDFWNYLLFAPGPQGEFTNPGPALLLLLVSALVALPALLRDRRRRIPALFLVAFGSAIAALVLSDGMQAFRTTLAVTTLGRFLTPALAGLAILGATVPGRFPIVLWAPAIIASLTLSLPRAWSALEVPGLVGGAAVALAGVGSLAALAVLHRRRTCAPVPLIAVACAIVGVGISVLEPLRAAHRYTIYATATSPAPIFHVNPLNPFFAAAWPIWQALDDGTPHRLAVTAGWERVGHNWYQYPLLGRRLNNRVLYVPVARDGSVIDHRQSEEIERRADFTTWLGRLVDENVDVVVSLAPRSTIEEKWMAAAPHLFEKAFSDPWSLHAAYRLNRAAVERLVRASVPEIQPVFAPEIPPAAPAAN
jgi:hypothetical protein